MAGQQIHLADALISNLKIKSNYKTSGGLAADIPHAPVYDTSDPTVGSILSQDDTATDMDKTHFVVVELHAVLGECTVEVATDVNPDPAGPANELVKSFDFEIIADDAMAIDFGVVGELIPK